MQFSTTQALFALALASVSAAAPTYQSLTCSPERAIKGDLRWNESPRDTRLALLPDENGSQQVVFPNDYHTPSSTPVQYYEFIPCDSAALGFTSSDTEQYGILKSTNLPSTYCVGGDDFARGVTLFTGDPCITADDKALITQYWRATKSDSGDGGPIMRVDFVGYDNSTDGSSVAAKPERAWAYTVGNPDAEHPVVVADNQEHPYYPDEFLFLGASDY